MDNVAGRLRDVGTALLGFRGTLVAGEPWPLSAAYGTEPEADWGPREVLAHVAEMLAYWPRELERVLAGDPATAVPFGRISTNPARIDAIAVGRERPTGELLDEIDSVLAPAVAFLDRLTPADLERKGAHPTRGAITVETGIETFLTGHLEGHVDQMRDILARSVPA